MRSSDVEGQHRSGGFRSFGRRNTIVNLSDYLTSVGVIIQTDALMGIHFHSVVEISALVVCLALFKGPEGEERLYHRFKVQSNENDMEALRVLIDKWLRLLTLNFGRRLGWMSKMADSPP